MWFIREEYPTKKVTFFKVLKYDENEMFYHFNYRTEVSKLDSCTMGYVKFKGAIENVEFEYRGSKLKLITEDEYLMEYIK